VPHSCTPAYAARRLLPEAEKGDLPPYPGRHVERARSVGLIDASPAAAVDATGVETRHVSEHFGKRCGEGKGMGHRQEAWPKLAAVLHIHSYLIIGAVTSIGPSQDSPTSDPPCAKPPR
jgi:hypothetical protein